MIDIILNRDSKEKNIDLLWGGLAAFAFGFEKVILTSNKHKQTNNIALISVSPSQEKEVLHI